MLYFLKNMCKVLEFLLHEWSPSPLLSSFLMFLYLYLYLFKTNLIYWLNIILQLSTFVLKTNVLFPSARHTPLLLLTYPVSLYHVVFLKKCLAPFIILVWPNVYQWDLKLKPAKAFWGPSANQSLHYHCFFLYKYIINFCILWRSEINIFHFIFHFHSSLWIIAFKCIFKKYRYSVVGFPPKLISGISIGIPI
jgi:hypothetical protein